MKIAVIYNYESKAVINLFGVPNRERYGLQTIKAITNALKQGGHQVKHFEGDKNIIANLEGFMPAVIAGERPGLVFNISYGIQGKARYTHIPGILEMIGVPYLGSSPDTHAIALDKVVTKMVLRQRGLPTPNFDVLDTPESPVSENLRYPLIVKPRSEAVSYGLKVVHDDKELREGVSAIYEAFNQPTLVEEYIEGREINVGVLGNIPPEPLPPVELDFGDGERIFSFEDKTKKSGRDIRKICPAPLTEEQTREVSALAVRAFRELGCLDCARVDFRMDAEGNFFILELNSFSAFSALRSNRRLRNGRIGVFAHTDEGRGLRHSGELLRKASSRAARVLVMRPGGRDGKVVNQRRGFRKYSLAVEGDTARLGSRKNGVDALTWLLGRAPEIAALSVPSKLTVSIQDVSVERFGPLMPHRVRATVAVAYLDPAAAQIVDAKLRDILKPESRRTQARIEILEDRPPFRRNASDPLIATLGSICGRWKLPFGTDSSLLPSAAGLVPDKIPTLCGLTPSGRELFTPSEAVSRGELLQRALVLALLLDSFQAEKT